MEAQVKVLTGFIEQLEAKDFALYFFTLDTKGNPTAGVANIYEHVKVLNELGYKAYILSEKADYKRFGDQDGMGVADWLGEEYANLPHVSTEGQTLNIQSTDFVIIPEIFANIMDQIKGFPCKKIVLSQSYDYLLELLPIGKRWTSDYGFFDVITTSQNQADYIKQLFPAINTHIVPVAIPSYFKPSEEPKVPIVALSVRTQADAAKIAKSFYLQYPLYKWITFKELRGLPRVDFAKALGESCLAVWVDDVAGFGTFPVEAMECGTPVIGKMPNLIPEWMETTDSVTGEKVIADNGIWTNTTTNIAEYIATFIKLFLEDRIPTSLLDAMDATTGRYTSEKQVEAIAAVYGQIVETRKAEFNNMLTSLTPIAQ